MEPFADGTPLWDLSHTSSFPQLADDDFLAILQKQFPSSEVNNSQLVDGVNPQNISRYSLPSITPPSEDSSPSPPNLNGENSAVIDESGDPALKRKATDENGQEGPSQKAQHTTSPAPAPGSSTRKSTPVARRKSAGTTPKDETRLLKRKEQNRAAQRAFRERKEKHVKDLEDKVAELEAKNEQAMTENENLRDLLSRLQTENLTLKQASFTFSVPKSAGATSPDTARTAPAFASQLPSFVPSVPITISPTRSTASPPASSATSPKSANPLEWSSLSTFDPSVLSLLDDSPQQTATDGAMQLDLGFGTPNTGLSPNTPFTTIASNPMFMSYASMFDSAQPSTNVAEPSSSFNFNFNGLTSWPTPPTNNNHDGSSLDDLLATYMSKPEFNNYANSSASESPVTHHSHVNPTNAAASSSSSSPSSSRSDPLFDQFRDSSASESEANHDGQNQANGKGCDGDCPKTKEELAKRIESSGPSPFAPPHGLRKGSDTQGPMILCEGTNFPKIKQSDQNVEVLTAWRSITSNPKFKDIDINELCTEFTNKAKCDGTKVVLEPQGVSCIIKNLTKLKQ